MMEDEIAALEAELKQTRRERDHAVALADRYRASIENAIQQLQVDSLGCKLPHTDLLRSRTDICGCGHMYAAHKLTPQQRDDAPARPRCELCETRVNIA